jgi:hypothetical protein
MAADLTKPLPLTHSRFRVCYPLPGGKRNGVRGSTVTRFWEKQVQTALNQTTRDSYTASQAVDSVSVQPERSEAKSKAARPATNLLFDFAAVAATLRVNGNELISNSTTLHQRRVFRFRPPGRCAGVCLGWHRCSYRLQGSRHRLP